MWSPDLELVRIAESLDLLLNLTPVNSASAWEKFRAARFTRPPSFVYREPQFEIDEMRRRLTNVAIDDVREPLIAGLLEAKRRELELQLDLLEARDSQVFLEISVKLYGAVTPDLLQRATGLLSALPGDTGDTTSVAAGAVRRLARAELSHYRRLADSFVYDAEIRGDTVDLMVNRGNVLIGASAAVRRARVHALLQHEIGTHVVTYFNATHQPLTLLRIGLDNYEETQEGIAVLAEYAADGLDAQRMRVLSARVVAVHRVLEGASFMDIFDELVKQHGFSERTSWSVTARVARSGGFTKDAMYLRGLVNVLEYLKRRQSLTPLLVGKISLAHIPAIEQLTEDGILRPPVLQPRWIGDGEARLDAIDDATTMLDLVKS